MQAETIRFDIVDQIMLVVHADVLPADADWARMSTVRNAHGNKLRGLLVIAPPRASINAAQRAEVAEFMKATGVSIAVVTDSALIRGVANAIGFLGIRVQAFASAEIDAALRYLLVPATQQAALLRRVELLKAQTR